MGPFLPGKPGLPGSPFMPLGPRVAGVAGIPVVKGSEHQRQDVGRGSPLIPSLRQGRVVVSLQLLFLLPCPQRMLSLCL